MFTKSIGRRSSAVSHEEPVTAPWQDRTCWTSEPVLSTTGQIIRSLVQNIATALRFPLQETRLLRNKMTTVGHDAVIFSTFLMRTITAQVQGNPVLFIQVFNVRQNHVSKARQGSPLTVLIETQSEHLSDN